MNGSQKILVIGGGILCRAELNLVPLDAILKLVPYLFRVFFVYPEVNVNADANVYKRLEPAADGDGRIRGGRNITEHIVEIVDYHVVRRNAGVYFLRRDIVVYRYVEPGAVFARSCGVTLLYLVLSLIERDALALVT